MTRQATSTTDHVKTLLITVNAPYHTGVDHNSYIEEFKNLIKTEGSTFDEIISIKLREIDSAYFITKGKLEEIKKLCIDQDIKHIFISETLTAKQERNLRDFLERSITDRTRLILDIFNQSAVTAEGKTQVQIAYLEYLKTRVSGQGIEFDQQAGSIGIRGGPGETAKEIELRYLDLEIRKLKRIIDKIQSAREVQRKQRLKNQETLLCLIGYTNAGKSTILNALTNSDVLAEDKLFATLDTTTKQLYINHKKIGVLSDTVGFIQQLPPKLIAAFKSTLSELQYADLLLHVVDLTNPNWQAHIEVVHQILEDLELHDKKMVYVFNKADLVQDLELIKPQINLFQPHVIISSKSKSGLVPLLDYLTQWHK
jgi:GTPase